jgi:head-tail adaptor
MIAAGTLRHQVLLQSASYTQNAAGEQVSSWATVATLRADVEQIGGSETVIAGETSSLGTYVVKHRYYAGLTSDFRYLWVIAPQGPYPVLNVTTVIQDAKKVEHTATCTAREGETA